MTIYDHNYFEENQTADRYVMKRLNGAELDAFENHFPLCDACMDALSVSTAMVRDLKNPAIKQALEGEMKPDSLQASARPDSSAILFWRRFAPIVSVAAVVALGFLGWRMVQPKPVNLQEWQTMAQGRPDEDFREIRLRVLRSVSSRPVVHINENIRFEIPFLDERVDKIPVRLYKSLGKKDVELTEIYLDHPGSNKDLSVFMPKGSLKPGSYYLLIPAKLLETDIRYDFEITEKLENENE